MFAMKTDPQVALPFGMIPVCSDVPAPKNGGVPQETGERKTIQDALIREGVVTVKL